MSELAVMSLVNRFGSGSFGSGNFGSENFGLFDLGTAEY